MEIEKWWVNDDIYCQRLTADYLENATKVLETSFYPQGNICLVLGVSKDPEAIGELRDLTNAAAKDGISVIAIDKNTNKVVGTAFNKIQVKNDPVFENFARSWKNPRSKAFVEIMATVDSLCNLFDYCQTDCLLELMFLTTATDYRGKGIAKKLSEITLEIGTSLAKGVNVRKSLDGTELPLGPRPKVISAMFATIATQKIGRHLGFEMVAEKFYNEMEFQGTKFSDVITNGSTKITLEYKRL
ncbi:hypothetical protein Zmor_016173 [Zophobas morio]|uniref:N-acetyltransferase domain-containing protein n=1 Tax=Zophobas morio TaxID=2755281 RepID=A0AA38IFQ4_9CUCU|nr:hypothetical protein Zmor_016173 [Zophobas morio]